MSGVLASLVFPSKSVVYPAIVVAKPPAKLIAPSAKCKKDASAPVVLAKARFWNLEAFSIGVTRAWKAPKAYAVVPSK